MVIALVIPTLEQGGAERVMSELANSFVGFHDISKIHLILLAKSIDFYQINDKVIIHRLGFENKNKVYKIFSEISTFFKLRKLLKLHRPSFVLSFMEKYNIFTILASRFLNIKVFVSDRSNPRGKVPKMISFLRNHLYKYSNGIIAQTSLSKDFFSEIVDDKLIAIIPNPVKFIKSYPDIIKENFIINVGRLVPEKGQMLLLNAFHKLNAPNWKLIILGDGPLKDQLLEHIMALGLEDRVIMPGSVSDIDEWLARSSIFAFSSISEGFPNALVEAMASGLPVVSFDCDAGPRDLIINNKNGFLVNVNDVDSMAGKLQMLISKPSLRLKIGNEAKKINSYLNKTNIASKYLKFMINSNL